MTFKIITFGCKVNTYESTYLKEKMISNDFKEVVDDADITIVNTCSVTNMADNKCKKMIRSIKRNNPNTILVVCGCSAEHNKEEYENMDIDILIGNRDKSILVNTILDYLKSKKKYIKFYEGRESTFENISVKDFNDKTRAFVKIQDGCDNFCAYCVIPYVRGSIRSKNIDDAYEEINELVNNGHKEIVLTGIDTGAYGKKEGYTLVDLIKRISKIKKLERIRISSIEMTSINDEFIKEIENNKKICGHLHVSLQSGSKRILKIMNRKYTKEEYYKKIELIRKSRPNINITTDIIVGFPSETEEEFQETVEFAKKCRFSKIHVFPYSKRDGTAASKMSEQIDNGVKKDRARRLIEIDKKLQKKYNDLFFNKELEVLIEEVKDNKSIGHTENYLKVIIDEALDTNKIYKVKVIDTDIEYVIGKILDA